MWIHLLPLGLIDGASGSVAAPAPEPATPSGVRHSRFLRRASKNAPRLPWEKEDEQPIIVAQPKRKRIPLPVVEALKEVAGPLPIETIREISAPVITIPDIGKAVLEDEDEDWLWLI